MANEYERKFQLTWMEHLGFENTYAPAVRSKAAATHHWKSISDLKSGSKGLHAGFTFEFRERQDGYPGLSKLYGFKFGKVSDMEPSLMYTALRDGKVDVVSAFSTDGRIAAYDLAVLNDDQGFFPPYEAAIVVRDATLDKYPELKSDLRKLSGAISSESMRLMNLEVDQNHELPRNVAAKFLESLSKD